MKNPIRFLRAINIFKTVGTTFFTIIEKMSSEPLISCPAPEEGTISDIKLVETLQERLTSLLDQVHGWKAAVKVFEQGGGCDFDSFMTKGSSTPSKRPAKSMSTRQDWSAFNLTQQYEILHNVAHEHTRVTLNFEALSMAIKASLASPALSKAIGLEGSDLGDPDERAYLVELLEEQAERSEGIMYAEEERMKKELEFLELKKELASRFTKVRETYASLLEKNHDAEVIPALPKKHKDNASVIENKMEDLKAEEDRLNQMRVMIQKLMLGVPGGCLNFDEETNKKHKAILIKCGEDLPALRGDAQ